MNFTDSIQIAACLGTASLLARPFGLFMARVYQGERTLLSPVIAPFENGLYRLCRIDSAGETGWQRYAAALLLLNGAMFVSLVLLLVLQGVLPFNPNQVGGASWSMALNTAISFATNTNWQTYSGESEVSYLVQMAGLAVHNFLSAATGMTVAIALIRGLVRRNAAAIGNFWVDITRSVLYILLPLSLVVALFLISQGVIQNLGANKSIALLQPQVTDIGTNGEQVLPMGPVASQEAIKELGTNGGGFFNANSAHPFENPTPLTNFVECLLILLIPAGLTFTFGKMAGNPGQGRTLFVAMLVLLIAAAAVMYWAETAGNPLVTKLGVSGPYLEGKEVRFGIGGSVLFGALTTATSCGAVNAMHDSLTPIGGMVPLVLMLLGEVVFGGGGAGLYTMLAFVVIAVFVAGLMIGRTPEYLGKKIEVREMRLSVCTVLVAGVLVLILVGAAVLLPAGLAGRLNPGAHGLSEILYGFASAANNNGSAFAGLDASTTFYRLLTAFAILVGRYVPILASLAMAGSLAAKKFTPPSLGTLPTDKLSFTVWLVVVIVIVGALTFFPALALGPVVEQLQMRQ